MKRSDLTWIGILAVYAGFIWLRDLQWIAAADDLLPIMAGLPLFVWLLWPLRFASGDTPIVSARALLVASLLFAAGVLTGVTLLLAISWTLLLWAWLSVRIGKEQLHSVRRLLVLPLFSFPWIATDFERLGWWFRLSGASAVEHLLSLGTVEVARQGTFLLVNGFQLSVEPACSGLNGLQSMLIAGTMLAFITLKNSPWYWAGLLTLPFAAWVANVLRILSGALVPVVMEPEAAARWVGPLHSGAGWIALGAMFALCWVLFSQLARVDNAAGGRVRQWARTAPWLEFAILGYAAWRCHGILDTWFANPFDRWGWIAFALWILPIGFYAQRSGLPRAGSGRLRPWLLGGGVGMIFLGDAGSLNALKYLGLALILTGYSAAHGRMLWAVTAVAWMPALGWLASRAGLQPDLAGIGRVLLALAGFSWAIAAQKKALRPATPARTQNLPAGEPGERTDEPNYAGSIKTLP